MSLFLLIDFGTSRTKSVLVDLETGLFSHPENRPSLPNRADRPGRFEVDPEAIRKRFFSLCAHYSDELEIPFQGIVLCSEMHGFVVMDGRDRPVTPYISWKDERSLEEIDGISTLDLVGEELGSSFKAITGMRPRPGFPLLNLVHLGRAGRLPAEGRVVSLPGWLAACTGSPRFVEHPTLLAGMALYDVRKGKISEELLGLIRELTGFSARPGDPAPEGEIAGYWHRAGEEVPLYAGVGDHQCSVLGAGLVSEEVFSVNLGTGSQVTALAPEVLDDETEIRPYFDGRRVRTLTHLPAGRALSEYIGFLEEVDGGRTDFWERLGKLSADDLAKGDLDFDLGVFPGSRGYRDGGRITRIREGRLTLHNYLSSLLRCFADQYVEIAALFDPDRRFSRCLLSGGIARRLPVLAEWIEGRTGYQVLPAVGLDESFLGLRALALRSDGRTRTCVEAQQKFGRSCGLHGSAH